MLLDITWLTSRKTMNNFMKYIILFFKKNKLVIYKLVCLLAGRNAIFKYNIIKA